MKSDYESRALKFARILTALFANCFDLADFENAIDRYNCTHTHAIRYAHGVSRIAILRADYVIKVDYNPAPWWADGRAGNIESEARVYAQAVADGMEHLLAKVTVGEANGRTFAIMPRIMGVGNEERDWQDFCSYAEYEWLNRHIRDLHEHNVGYRGDKVCVIDYAWEEEEETDW